jgi:hypothetical protein
MSQCSGEASQLGLLNLPRLLAVTSSVVFHDESDFVPLAERPVPAASRALAWTNTSFDPSSGVMKPNPLATLKNFTVPAILIAPSLSRSAMTASRQVALPWPGQLRIGKGRCRCRGVPKQKARARPTMKRTSYRHMGDFDGKYKLTGKATDTSKRIVVTATGWRRKVPLLWVLHLPPISPAWPPATGSALDMLRSPQQ